MTNIFLNKHSVPFNIQYPRKSDALIVDNTATFTRFLQMIATKYFGSVYTRVSLTRLFYVDDHQPVREWSTN